MSIGSEDGGVQRLDVAEGIFVANRSIVCLSIDDGHQQRQQKGKKGGHCELLLDDSSKWLVSVHHRREPTFIYAQAHRSDTSEHHGRSNAGSRQWVLPTLSTHTTSCLFRAWRIMCVNKVNGTLKSQRQPRTWSLDSGQNKA